MIPKLPPGAVEGPNASAPSFSVGPRLSPEPHADSGFSLGSIPPRVRPLPTNR